MIKKETVEKIKNACETSISMKEACSKVGMHFNTFSKYAKELGVYKSNQGGKGTHKKSSRSMTKERFIIDILGNKLTGISGERLKGYLYKYEFKKEICEVCCLTEWQGEKIPLEIDHLNGNHYDNHLENLRIICPNCHSQTSNFRGKNKNKTGTGSSLKN